MCFVSYEVFDLKLHLFIFKRYTVQVPIICISNLAEGEGYKYIRQMLPLSLNFCGFISFTQNPACLCKAVF